MAERSIHDKVDAVSSQGRTPRFLIPGPDGRRLYVPNEDSDTIVRMAIDRSDRRPVCVGEPLTCDSPVFVLFSPRGSEYGASHQLLPSNCE